jgi:zinc/manganese transport system permease protein
MLVLNSLLVKAWIAGTMISISCGLISPFIMYRRASFASHSIGHTSITGACAAFFLGIPSIAGQLIFNVLSAIMISMLDSKMINRDINVGTMLNFSLGISVYLLYLFKANYTGRVLEVFFGNIWTTSNFHLVILFILAIFICLILTYTARPLLFTFLEPTLSLSLGLKVRQLDILFFIALAITTTMACQILGALLVFTLLIGPGSIAIQWCDDIYTTWLVSVGIALSSVYLSILLSWNFDIPMSFCLTTITSLAYLISVLWNK